MKRIRIADAFSTKRVSRGDGARLRKMIEDDWHGDGAIVLDFEGLQIASVSFFDEALGILAKQYSLVELTKKISVENITAADRNLLNRIVSSRADERRAESATR